MVWKEICRRENMVRGVSSHDAMTGNIQIHEYM